MNKSSEKILTIKSMILEAITNEQPTVFKVWAGTWISGTDRTGEYADEVAWHMTKLVDANLNDEHAVCRYQLAARAADAAATYAGIVK